MTVGYTSMTPRSPEKVVHGTEKRRFRVPQEPSSTSLRMTREKIVRRSGLVLTASTQTTNVSPFKWEAEHQPHLPLRVVKLVMWLCCNTTYFDFFNQRLGRTILTRQNCQIQVSQSKSDSFWCLLQVMLRTPFQGHDCMRRRALSSENRGDCASWVTMA